MNDKQGLGNGASAETQEIRCLISEHFAGARIFLTTCYNIYSKLFKDLLIKIKTFNQKDIQI